MNLDELLVIKLAIYGRGHQFTNSIRSKIMSPSDDRSPSEKDPLAKETNRRGVLRAGAFLSVSIGTLTGCIEGETRGDTNPTDAETPTSSPEQETQTPTSTQNDDDSVTETDGDTPTETDEDTPTETDEDEEHTQEETQTEEANGWYIRPDGNPASVPSQLVCDEDHEGRFPQRFDESELRWGDDDGRWELRVDSLTAKYGETVAVRLTNVSDEEQHHASEGDFNIQVKTDVGWQDVRVRENTHDSATRDELQKKQPGEGPRWEITMTEEELPETYGDMGKVCPGLPSGRYRFVYTGTETQPLGVAFDFKNP